jgi:hypothetical protein
MTMPEDHLQRLIEDVDDLIERANHRGFAATVQLLYIVRLDLLTRINGVSTGEMRAFAETLATPASGNRTAAEARSRSH